MTSLSVPQTTDAAEWHDYPVRHTPQWFRQGVSNGREVLWNNYLTCWCGVYKSIEETL